MHIFGQKIGALMGWSEWGAMMGLGRGVWVCECCGEEVREPLIGWFLRVLRGQRL